MIASRKHMDTTPIDQNVYEYIAQYKGITARICGIYLRLRHTTVCLITTYFYDSIGLDELNHKILVQIDVCQRLIGLPIIVIGDFNIEYEDMVQSGWLDVPKLKAFKPDEITSTLYGIEDRVIDYVLMSESIVHIFKFLKPVFNTPWRPHVSLALGIHSRPRQAHALHIWRPRELPMEDALKKWKSMSEDGKIIYF